MNSKQRVLAAINGIEPDRVPVDMWALPPVTDRLRAHFSVDDDEAVWQSLGIDLRSVWPAYVGPPLEAFEDGSYIDWWGVRKKMFGPFEDVVAPPLADARTPADVAAHTWPNPDWFDHDSLRPTCEALSEYALVIRDPGPNATCVLRVAMFLRGMERFLMDLVENPDLARAIIAQVEGFYLEFNRRILETVGDLTDIYFVADDVGTQSGLLISPRMFREFIAPGLRRFIAQGKQYGQIVMYHTDGAVRRLIPDFIELGVDILNPIQVSAEDMELASLRRDFGDALCFHGGLDIITVLSRSTPDQVRAEVERICSILGRESCFILAPTNNIMPETPIENILALYEAARATRHA